jgi:hypothetical protein
MRRTTGCNLTQNRPYQRITARPAAICVRGCLTGDRRRTRVGYRSRLHEGFVVLGEPLEDSPDVLLIVRDSGPDEVARRIEDDPWASLDLLTISPISKWQLRMGALPE